MAQKTIQGTESLARQIRSRRCELGLTIEEAASRAGVGTKTWCRYEAGASIRRDKAQGICRALSWHGLPAEGPVENSGFSVQAYRDHTAWSRYLEHTFGVDASLSFAAGSDLLYDHIRADLAELSSLPAGTHIGQLPASCLSGQLPEQFLMHYDYAFLHRMKCTLDGLRLRAKNDLPMTAHSVLEELLLYLCQEEASALLELCGSQGETDRGAGDWVFDLFDDMDLITFLYAGVHLEAGHPYHFSRWAEPQFHQDNSQNQPPAKPAAHR